MIIRLLSIIALLSGSLASRAESLADLPAPLPASYVSDLRGLLAADTRTELDRLAARLDDTNKGQLAIAVIATTGGVDPRQFATELFNRWGVGDRSRNNGTLILLAKNDRAAEIILGEGIDNAANRAHAEQVMSQAMVPRFRQANYDQALISGATELLQRVYTLDLSRPAEQAVADTPPGSARRDAPAAALAALPVPTAPTQPAAPIRVPAAPAPKEDASPSIIALGLGVIAILVSAVLWLVATLLRGLWWLTGARWMSRRCSSCNSKMQQLSEAADDTHLSAGQLTEEKLGSVDHRVFLCPACGKVDSLARRAWFTRYSDCSNCSSRAMSSTSKTITSPTRYSTGLAEVTETCKHCAYVRTVRRTLPVLPPPSTSSSSSGSFGGGRSSGGGASGRW